MMDDDESSDEECPLTQQRNKKWTGSKIVWKFYIAAYLLLAILTCFVIFILIHLSLSLSSQSSSSSLNKNTKVPPSNGLLFSHSHGAVATDNKVCSEIGINILQEGGNAVDAAVASTVCMCLVAPEKTGFGGGGIAMVYNENQTGNPLVLDFATNTISGSFGIGKIRVPSVFRGLDVFHSSGGGKLPWSRVIKPGAILARKGFNVSFDLASKVAESPEHGIVYGHLITGETLKIDKLADTLDAIAQHGSEILYNGSLSVKLLRDSVTPEHLFHQLAAYEPKIIASKKNTFANHIVYSPKHSPLFQLDRQNDYLLKKENESLNRQSYSSVVAADADGNFVSILTGMSVSLGLKHMTGAGFLLDTASNNLNSLTPIIFHSQDEKEKTTIGTLGLDDPIIAIEILSSLFTIKGASLSWAIERHERNNVKSVNGILRKNNNLTSHSGSRGGGIAYKY